MKLQLSDFFQSLTIHFHRVENRFSVLENGFSSTENKFSAKGVFPEKNSGDEPIGITTVFQGFPIIAREDAKVNLSTVLTLFSASAVPNFHKTQQRKGCKPRH